jgi:competence protein ComEC
METKNKRLIAWFLIPVFVITVMVFASYFEIEPDTDMRVHFYNVGQGDSVFIKTHEGNQILLDGGPGSTVLQELGKDMPFFDRTIEMIILSHPHADHVTGLIEVLKRYKVKKVLVPEVEFDSEPFKEFLRLVDVEQAEKIYAREGLRIWLDAATALDIYYPGGGKFIADNDAKGLDGAKLNPNDISIVAKLTFGRTRFLFTGDAGFDVENIILPKYNLDADVLKAGHHGSRFSSSDAFLSEVSPAFAVIMVGKNSYGHPTEEVLDNLKEVNAKVFRTDNGTVEFASDGGQIFVIE